MAGRKRKPAYPRNAWTPMLISLVLAVFGGGFTILAGLPGAVAQNGNGAAIASLRGQIQRYGCNLPQYATSVAGCRSLHARLKSLQSGDGARPGARRPHANYSSPSNQPAPRRNPPRPSSGGGFFSALFGGFGQSRTAPRYDSYGTARPESSDYTHNSWQNNYPAYMQGAGRYRTLCVRTCDGYYWPMSFSTTSAGFKRDANQCKSACSAPTRLFYHRNPGADVEHMIDLRGQPYSGMENAYRYREEYVENCRCKPEPWSEAAKEAYEQRSALTKPPAKTESAALIKNAPSGSSRPSPYHGENYPVAVAPRPRPRRRPKPGFFASQPKKDGHWWAGSW